jgi:hypothetical protein
MTFIWTARTHLGVTYTVDLERCRASVTSSERWSRSHQWQRKAVVFKELTGTDHVHYGVGKFGFCKLHDPDVVAAKRQERFRKYGAKLAKRMRATP